MTKKTRLIIFLLCVGCFFVIAPILVAYSLGYKFNFKSFEVVTTGGIYVRSFPVADRIYIDFGAPEKPGLFSNSVFVQGLVPQDHTVLIEKTGYHNYQKTLPVVEKEVTKIEDVLLIKENIIYGLLSKNVDSFSLSKNNQNILTAKKESPSTVLNYFNINNPGLPKTFSITSLGAVSDIQWSDDSRFALVKVLNATVASYYIVDTSAQALSPIKLAYLDSNSKKLSFNPQNSTQLYYLDANNIYLYDGVLDQTDPTVKLVIKGVLDYSILNNNFVWLTLDGFLNQSDLLGVLQERLSKNSIITKSTLYNIFLADGRTFVQESSNLFVVNQGELLAFLSPEPTKKIILSPDSKHMVYDAGNRINIYSFEDEKYVQLYIGDKISDLYWLNNDYLIFNDQGKIVILEIDWRGSANSVTLSSEATLQDNSPIHIQPSQSFYNRQDNKLYILSENTLVVSEKLVP